MSKSLKKILVTGASLLMMASVGVGSSNVQAKHHHHIRTHKTYHHSHRSTWKHYAPYSIRGYWASKHHHKVWGLTLLSSGVAFNPSGAAISNWSHPIYKTDGHHAYSIKTSSRSHNNTGRVSGENYYIKVRGYRIYAWTNGNYIGSFHKSSRKYLFGY